MKRLLLLALLLPLGLPVAADTPPRYRLTVLPLTFSGYNGIGTNDEKRGGINAQGKVVGMALVKSGSFQDSRAALWQKGRSLRILDKQPVTNPNIASGQDFFYPSAINTRGETTAIRTVSCSGAYTIQYSSASVLWNGRDDRISQRFPSDPDTSSVALGLNDWGDVVGSFVYDDTNADAQTNSSPPLGTASRHAFLRHGNRVSPLWEGSAWGINNNGWIIGVKDVDDDDSHARGVLWRSGHITLFKMQPAAINELGEIAGNIPLNDDFGIACVWREGKLTRLSKGTSRSNALNNHGQIVGVLDNAAPRIPDHAALWQNGRTYDLNRCTALPPGWVLTGAIGINDRGWIIGEGGVYKTPTDKQPASTFTFLLTPR